MDKNYQRKAPVEIGNTYKVECVAIGEKGDGICKKDNFVIIVPGAEEGNEYHVKINKVVNKAAFGEII